MSNTHNVPKRHDIHARARTLAADYITLRDLKSSDDPLWLEEDFDFGSSPSQGDSPLLFRFSIHQDDLRRLGFHACQVVNVASQHTSERRPA